MIGSAFIPGNIYWTSIEVTCDSCGASYLLENSPILYIGEYSEVLASLWLFEMVFWVICKSCKRQIEQLKVYPQGINVSQDNRV